MQVLSTERDGVRIIKPKVFADPRGILLETGSAERYSAAGLPGTMVHDNLSSSTRGVLRGLHYQYPKPQGKLVYALAGTVFNMAVDLRAGSPTFGRWTSVELSAESKRHFFAPAGVPHGFYIASDRALVASKCTHPCRPQCDRGIVWNDPRIGVRRKIDAPLRSENDARAPRLHDIPADGLPQWTPQ